MAMLTITEIYVGGMTIIDLGYGQLVASQTTPGSWYVIERGRCSCPSFEHRGRCKHLEAVREMVGEESPDDEPLPTREEEMGIMLEVDRENAEQAIAAGECEDVPMVPW